MCYAIRGAQLLFGIDTVLSLFFSLSSLSPSLFRSLSLRKMYRKIKYALFFSAWTFAALKRFYIKFIEFDWIKNEPIRKFHANLVMNNDQLNGKMHKFNGERWTIIFGGFAAFTESKIVDGQQKI